MTPARHEKCRFFRFGRCNFLFNHVKKEAQKSSRGFIDQLIKPSQKFWFPIRKKFRLQIQCWFGIFNLKVRIGRSCLSGKTSTRCSDHQTTKQGCFGHLVSQYASLQFLLLYEVGWFLRKKFPANFMSTHVVISFNHFKIHNMCALNLFRPNETLHTHRSQSCIFGLNKFKVHILWILKWSYLIYDNKKLNQNLMI